MVRLQPTPLIDALLDLALAEDLGTGDVTSEITIPPNTRARATLLAKAPLILCGQPAMERLLWRAGPGAPAIEWQVPEGARVTPGAVVGVLHGDLRSLLALERTALNLMQRMSGVATLTDRYVQAVAGTRARVVDTRKTLPGWRALDKYAVRIGGGVNHRATLDGGVLIKDNHLEAAGGVKAAVEAARAYGPHPLRIEVEVEDLAGLEEALEARADVILLDNFTPEITAEAVRLANGRALMESSGGIDLTTIRAYAEAGVDLIAVGALTHSAVAVDLSVEILALGEEAPA